MTTDKPIVFTTESKTRIFRLTAHDIDELAENLCGPDDWEEFLHIQRKQADLAKLDELYEKWLQENPGLKSHHKNLDNSMPLDLNLWSDSPAIEALISNVFEVLNAHLASIQNHHKQTYRTCIKVVILNLLTAYKRNPEKYVACSFNPSFYKGYSRYNKYGISRTIIKIINAMAATGFIGDLAKGFNDRATEKAKRTRIRAGKPLTEAFDKILGEDPELTQIKRHHEEIVLKLPKAEQKPGQPKTAEYEEKKTSLERRRNVRRFNRRLQQHEILLNLDDDQRDLLAWIQAHRDEADIEIDAEEIPHFNTAKDRLYRVFNDGDFKKKRGGRFYGHWVQSIPAKIAPFRSLLTIDDEPVVELDYSNLHPHMLYRKERKSVPEGDLYELEGVAPEKRGQVKALFNAMLNADSINKAIWAVLDPFPEGLPKEKRPTVTQLFDAILEGKGIYKAITSVLNSLPDGEDRITYGELKSISNEILAKHAELKAISEKILTKHAPIRRHFGTGVGLDLQYKDSTIAERIMVALDKQDIVCFPIHDSFIVQAKHEQSLREAMAEEYRQVIKGEPPRIDKKRRFLNLP